MRFTLNNVDYIANLNDLTIKPAAETDDIIDNIPFTVEDGITYKVIHVGGNEITFRKTGAFIGSSGGFDPFVHRGDGLKCNVFKTLLNLMKAMPIKQIGNNKYRYKDKEYKLIRTTTSCKVFLGGHDASPNFIYTDLGITSKIASSVLDCPVLLPFFKDYVQFERMMKWINTHKLGSNEEVKIIRTVQGRFYIETSTNYSSLFTFAFPGRKIRGVKPEFETEEEAKEFYKKFLI